MLEIDKIELNTLKSRVFKRFNFICNLILQTLNYELAVLEKEQGGKKRSAT